MKINLSLKNKIKIWKIIYKIRRTEEIIALNYYKEKMRCPTHLSIGQEAVPATLSLFINQKDQAISGHRGHAHYLAKGGNLKKMLCEIHGKANGCCEGKGGSMHLKDDKVGFVGTTAIVGNSIPIGVGLGLSIKLKKKKNLAIIYLGDGAIEEGVFYESLNFAIIKKIPVLFICENNFYSVYSSLKVRQPKNRKIYKLSKGIGCKSDFSDGNDCAKIFKKIKKAVEYIKSGKGPFFLEFATYRHREHCGPNFDDNLNYRPKKLSYNWIKKKDPLTKIEKNIVNKYPKKIKYLENEKIKINNEISSAFKFAENSPYPKTNILKKIYAK